MGILAVISYLYYESAAAFFLLMPAVFIYIKRWEKACMEIKKREFAVQFQEAIRSLGAALYVGYSLENAMKETKKDLSVLYGEGTAIQRELDYMVRQIYLQIPMEQILTEWSRRVDQEDLRSFVNVFSAAKKSGGDSLAVIRDSISQIRAKMEMQREIDTILAARKYEFRVMSVIPFGMIAYMKISFPEFMDSLYGNPAGTGVMSVCLGIYAGAYYLGRRIVNIEI